MKHYAVAEISITDPTWTGDYVANVTGMVEGYGGRYLARTPNYEKIEGDRPGPHLFLLIEWPSKEAANAFYESEEYRPFLAARRNGSTGEFALVAGEDLGGVAKMSA